MTKIISLSESTLAPPAPVVAVPTVLVVEDDRGFAYALKESLRAKNIKTLLAHDGNAGLAIAICRKPDFMILDTRMPRRSGYLVLEYLATETDLTIPTVLLGENEGQRHRAYGKMLGAIDFLEKPIQSTEVVTKIAALLKPRKTCDRGT